MYGMAAISVILFFLGLCFIRVSVVLATYFIVLMLRRLTAVKYAPGKFSVS